MAKSSHSNCGVRASRAPGRRLGAWAQFSGSSSGAPERVLGVSRFAPRALWVAPYCVRDRWRFRFPGDRLDAHQAAPVMSAALRVHVSSLILKRERQSALNPVVSVL